ncbi:hypothetical protein B0T25DRAFT_513992 [Lasiosphaeria hispida]|uniref:Uncharacterized protein n=1 Tax=Lasiosphaeria hispida TaxID=260671 RepID=A0AAJ0HWL2_9PEZI|nr:hypothetical protein B0T25DRAFT_513992 [Lasiosphaeria hispida]
MILVWSRCDPAVNDTRFTAVDGKIAVLQADVSEIKVSMKQMDVRMQQMDMRTRNSQLRNPAGGRIQPMPTFVSKDPRPALVPRVPPPVPQPAAPQRRARPPDASLPLLVLRRRPGGRSGARSRAAGEHPAARRGPVRQFSQTGWPSSPMPHGVWPARGPLAPHAVR